MTSDNSGRNLGRILRQQRGGIPLTLQELAAMSGVSTSHLGRIERGERFPSARILRKVAKPLGFEESELFTLADYLSPQPSTKAETQPGGNGRRLDPYVYSKYVSPRATRGAARRYRNSKHIKEHCQRGKMNSYSLLKSLAL